MFVVKKKAGSRLFRERVIILRTIKYSESDLIIHGLNPMGAKQSFIARGALRSKKRFGGGVLEATHLVDLAFKKRPEDDRLIVVDEAHLVKDFQGLRLSYEKLELGLFIIEGVYRVSQEGEIHSEGLFNLLGHALSALEETDNLKLFKLQYMLKLLFQQGVLQVESWMKPILAKPLKEGLADVNFTESEIINHLVSVERMYQVYINTAEGVS